MITSAAYLKELGQPLVYSDQVTIPDLLPGQVLVKLAYTGVCHSQLMEARGGRGEDRFLPHMLGHEGSGVVVHVGKGVTKVREGDRVVVGWIKGDGANVPGTQYTLPDGTKINAGGVTTFQKHTVTSENRVSKLPSFVPMEVAALFGCAIPTGAGIVFNTLQPAEGSTIAIWGLGGIGLSALLATRQYKCSKVIAIDVNPEKLQLAREMGATHIINARVDNPYAKVMELTSNTGVDYSVEAAGLTESIEGAFRIVRKGGGQCVFASHPKEGSTIRLDPFELICGKRIMGSWGGDSHPDRDIPKFSKLYQDGHLPLEKFVSKMYKLDQINQAMEDLEEKKIVRAMVEIDSSIK